MGCDGRRREAPCAQEDGACGCLDDGEEGVAGVGGGGRVGGGGGVCDRCAEAAVRVAALPLVGERARRLAPAAGCDLECLSLFGCAAGGGLAGGDEGGVGGGDGADQGGVGA